MASESSGKVLRTLLALLKHPAWQVRAEAAEAVGKLKSSLNWDSGEVDESNQQLQADTYAALVKLLGDPDAFVASRAVEGLSSVDTATAVEPLILAVKTHPELGSKILVQLGGGRKTRALALPHLRKFASDPNPVLRAAALDALFEAVPDLMDEELTAAVAERDGKVRIKAAEVLFRLMEKRREQAIESVSRERDRIQVHSGTGRRGTPGVEGRVAAGREPERHDKFRGGEAAAGGCVPGRAAGRPGKVDMEAS